MSLPPTGLGQTANQYPLAQYEPVGQVVPSEHDPVLPASQKTRPVTVSVPHPQGQLLSLLATVQSSVIA